MNYQSPNLDMDSFHGVLLTGLFIFSGQMCTILPTIPIMPFLQGLSYFLGSVVAVDTLMGSPIKTYLSKYFKRK